MSGINAQQEQEVTFLSGVTAQGTIAASSYWTWNNDTPATYAGTSSEAKWGAPTAGTGATITVAFDAGSNWSGTERAAFQSAMHLWSEVANVRFVVTDGDDAKLVITRADDGSAFTGGSAYRPGAIGSAQLGRLAEVDISIDTSVRGFGPIGAGFSVAGGYPWLTLVHEIGHAIGLGHAGAYDDAGEDSPTPPMLTRYDATAWSVMSYINAGDRRYPDVEGNYNWGRSADGSPNVALTPMPLDILAAQRLYGLPVETPLSGGQTYGFHTNIQGDTARFFDFTVNRAPVVTLWNAGANNTLDLSGYASINRVTLTDGTFSSVGGQLNNVAIAYGTRIDTLIGGTDIDVVRGNDNGDVIMGNAGADDLTGGAGNDHIYGNLASGVQGAADGGDTIATGGGTNYVNGNAGDDVIAVEGDANRIYGGAGDDRITITSTGVNHVNGNAGDDRITVYDGTNFLFGGRGNDMILIHAGNNVISGDLGDDTIIAGSGVDVMTGGDGRDVFTFGSRAAPLGRDGALNGYHDEITDFTRGADTINLADHGAAAVLHGDRTFASAFSAVSYAQSLLDAANARSVVALQVGSDTYLFYNQGGTSNLVDSAIKLDGIEAAKIETSDFLS